MKQIVEHAARLSLIRTRLRGHYGRYGRTGKIYLNRAYACSVLAAAAAATAACDVDAL